MLRNWGHNSDELAEIWDLISVSAEPELLPKRNKLCSWICIVAPFRRVAGPPF
jgi:hypothetical protein